ncbi:MAG: hypothetical protein JXA03_12675 [Bacteroidales bacterium]|nr:hypothetical protein [Bacteroidales bacterium]
MQTIRLRVNDKVYRNLMWFLERFRKDEIQVINEDSEFISMQEYLKEELKLLENGQSEFLTLEELDHELEKTIQKYEA